MNLIIVLVLIRRPKCPENFTTIDYDHGTDAFLSDLEKLHIIKPFLKMNGNKARVAETLGLSKNSI